MKRTALDNVEYQTAPPPRLMGQSRALIYDVISKSVMFIKMVYIRRPNNVQYYYTINELNNIVQQEIEGRGVKIKYSETGKVVIDYRIIGF